MPRAESSIVVGVPVDQAYTVWRQFDNFPRFMNNVEEVSKLDGEGKMSHWKVKGPFGYNVEFNAEMTRDEPNQRIAWNSRGDGTVTTSGQVTFTEQNQKQTLVHVILNWEPPAGKLGETVAKLTSDPQQELEEDLGRFKEMVEGGKFGTIVPQS